MSNDQTDWDESEIVRHLRIELKGTLSLTQDRALHAAIIALAAREQATTPPPQEAEPASGQMVEPVAWLLRVKPSFQQGRGKYERTEHRGYTDDILQAGRFTEEWAKKCAADCPDKLEAIPDPYDAKRYTSAPTLPAHLVAVNRSWLSLARCPDRYSPVHNAEPCQWCEELKAALSGSLAFPAHLVAVPRDALSRIVGEFYGLEEVDDDEFGGYMYSLKAALSATEGK